MQHLSVEVSDQKNLYDLLKLMCKQKSFSYLQVLLPNIYLIRLGNSIGGHLEYDKNLIVSLVKTLEV